MSSDAPRRVGLLQSAVRSLTDGTGLGHVGRAVRRCAWVAMLVGATLQPGAASPRAWHRYDASRMSMACLYAIEAYGASATELAAAAEEALDEVDRIDRLMSHYDPKSPLSRINREAASHPVQPPRELFDFLQEALRYSALSQGAFDVTVGPLMKTWGFFRGEGRLPSRDDLASARRLVGFRHVTLDARARSVTFDREGVELDLGGIAKGYAVDRAVQLLRDRGVPAALISAGGSTTYALGAPPGRGGWDVRIQDPLDARMVATTLSLRDRSLSIAGRSEKWFEAHGVRYSHIMDPRTGTPVQGMLTVAVVSGTGTAGDALDDALFVLGPAGSRALLAKVPGAEGLFFLPGGPRGWTMVRERS